MDILNDEDVWDEIKQHASYLRADSYKDDPYAWKDYLNDAEYDVKAKWALSVYNAVKAVLDKGENLT